MSDTDIKMSEWLIDDRTVYTLKTNGTNDFWFQINRSGYSENHVREFAKNITGKLNNHDKLTTRVAELEAALTKQKRALDGAMSQLSRPCNSINDLSFIAFVGVVEKEINDLLKESE